MASRRLFVLLLLVLAPSAAGGAGTGVSAAVGPPVAADRIEIRLAPAAARAARGRPAVDVASGRRARHASLGIAALDAVAARAPGLTFERTFRGEAPPAAGSDQTDFTAFYRVLLPAAMTVEQALAAFGALPEVASAEAIPVLSGAAFPNDSLFGVSTWFYQASRYDVHAPEAWDVTVGDTGVVIAILDTGIIPYHPDLAAQIWTNFAEAAGALGVDDDGNGYVDDAHGWDFVDLVAGDQVTPGEDWDEEDNDPNDFVGHGTKVAGIAGAATNNTIGVAGTAQRTRLMPLRVMWGEGGSLAGTVRMDFAAEALLYATRMGAAVVNCSFETASLASLTAAANEAVRAGVTIVCAAGNSSPFHFLADREDVVAVGAVTNADVVAAFSNVGPFVDFCAPGVGIHSTYVLHAAADSVSQRQPHYDGGQNGTSFSAPFAAGAAALVQSHRKALALPPLSPMDMIFRLRETADDITAQNPGGADYGTGRLNLYRALTQTSTSNAFRTGSRTVGPAVVFATNSGATRIAFATNSARLVIVDAVTTDTLANVAMPARLSRQLAAGSLGAGLGSAIFGGTIDGRVSGHRLDGTPLATWPVTAASGIAMNAGPAIGDLFGDGNAKIVCGAADGSLHAWRPDGGLVTGFPVSPFASGFSGAVALADVDGAPGSEIVCLSQAAELTVIRADGSTLTGWPQSTGFTTTTISPVVARLGSDPAPAILVPLAAGLRAYRPDGTVRWSASFTGNLQQDPAVGDLNGDGYDEIVLALNNGRLLALDSAGVALPGWPVVLGGASQGPPVIGPLLAGGAPGVLAFRVGSLMAFGATGQALASFPRPGIAGNQPTLAELDGDGHTEIAAGIGPDSLFYRYDAGAGTYAAPTMAWPTPRGNAARTGSRIGAPAPLEFDDVAPGAIGDLVADSVSLNAIRVKWTAPGDDGTIGLVTDYDVRVESPPGVPVIPLIVAMPFPVAAWATQIADLWLLQPGTDYSISVRARDEESNPGPWSNTIVVTTGADTSTPPPTPAVTTLRPRARPSRLPVLMDWTVAGGAAGVPRVIRLFDLSGRMVRAIPVAGASGTATWDGRGDHGERLRAGLYLARLEGGGARAGTKVVLVP